MLFRSEEVEADSRTNVSLGKALEIYGEDLVVAATGAIAKKGQGPGGRSTSFTTA